MKKLVTWFRKKTDNLVLPVVQVLARLGVHPNALTVCAFISGIVAVFFLQTSLFFVFGMLHLFFDKVDGALARFAKQKSKVGFFLDHASDRSIEAFFLVQVASLFAVVPWVLGLFIVYNIIFLLRRRELFFARTILFLGAFLGLVELALIVAGVIYCIGLVIQVKEILLK